jgi:hypothetical protein
MNEDTSPGNDGLTVEFYKFFWAEIKYTFMASIIRDKLSSSLLRKRIRTNLK